MLWDLLLGGIIMIARNPMQLKAFAKKKDHILEPQLLYMAVGGERRIRTFEG